MALPEITLESINRAVREDPAAAVLEAETAYREKVADAADTILQRGAAIVMLAGPSSAGKTTTAARLSNRLRRHDSIAYTISLDDFYRGADSTPRLPDGRPDFETVHALELELLTSCLTRLVETRVCDLPRFDFVHGRRIDNARHLELDPQDVVIVEGLHALNPLITDLLPQEKLYKLYLSVSTRIYDAEEGETDDNDDTDGRIFFHKRDLRFTRRLVRDHRFRASSVQKTYALWPSVTQGEDRYLFPFEDRWDRKLDSFHLYEPCVLAKPAMKLLRQVTPDDPHYPDAQRLLRRLSRFAPLSPACLPQDSLLHEFLG